MKIKSIEEIKDFCQKYAEPLNVKVADVEFKQGKNPTLTIFITKDGGVDLNTCESFHNAIFEPIDELNPTFDEPYTLNVSSLGLDRPYKTDEDYLSHIGQKVEVYLKQAVKGKKEYDGILQSYNGKEVVIKVSDKLTLSLELKSVVKMNDYIDFN